MRFLEDRRKTKSDGARYNELVGTQKAIDFALYRLEFRRDNPTKILLNFLRNTIAYRRVYGDSFVNKKKMKLRYNGIYLHISLPHLKIL